MKNLFFSAIVFFLASYICGLVFFRVLHYIEQRHILKKRFRNRLALPCGSIILLVSGLILRGAAGLTPHPLAELAAGCFLAALFAAGTSLSLLLVCKKSRKKPVLCSASAPSISIVRTSVRRAG